MAAIVYDTFSEGYGPDQCSTMTVGELIDLLQRYDPDTKIYLGFDDRWTYGGITADRFDDLEEEPGDDEEVDE